MPVTLINVADSSLSNTPSSQRNRQVLVPASMWGGTICHICYTNVSLRTCISFLLLNIWKTSVFPLNPFFFCAIHAQVFLTIKVTKFSISDLVSIFTLQTPKASSYWLPPLPNVSLTSFFIVPLQEVNIYDPLGCNSNIGSPSNPSFPPPSFLPSSSLPNPNLVSNLHYFHNTLYLFLPMTFSCFFKIILHTFPSLTHELLGQKYTLFCVQMLLDETVFWQTYPC